MPSTEVLFYREPNGDAPVWDWLQALRRDDRPAYAKCVSAIERLGELGHELRRPTADYLKDGIYELRVRRGRVHYRILYFFLGRNVAILGHAITKEGAVPDQEIERCAARKRRFESDAPLRLR